jgi:hypothetical protein
VKPPTERAVYLWSAAVAATVLAFAALQYRMPGALRSAWGLNPEGAAQFRAMLGLPFRPAEGVAFRGDFLVLLAAMAAAYLGLFACIAAGARVPEARLAWLTRGLLVVVALLAPPALSTDVYAYVGYARLAVVHHLNPYVATQRALVQLGDPTAPFLRWDIASPYGPVWMLLCIAVEAPLRAAPLVVAVVAFKLVAAAAVAAIAEGGRRLAEAFAPGAGPRAYVCLALNPLLLVEGAGSAHNDVVMMAGVVAALLLAARGRTLAAAFLLGLAAAVKLPPLLLVPWVLLAAWRDRPLARRMPLVALALGLALAPSLLGYAAFGADFHLFAGLGARLHTGRSGLVGAHPLVTAAIFAAAYAALTAWVARGPLERVLLAWTVASLLVLFLAAGIWFPWYLVWPVTTALVLQRRGELGFAALLFVVALLLMVPYVR